MMWWLFRRWIWRRLTREWPRALLLACGLALAVSVSLAMLLASAASIRSFAHARTPPGGALAGEIRSPRGEFSLSTLGELARDLFEVAIPIAILEAPASLTWGEHNSLPSAVLGIDTLAVGMERPTDQLPIWVPERLISQNSPPPTILVHDRTFVPTSVHQLPPSLGLEERNCVVLDIVDLQSFLAKPGRVTTIALGRPPNAPPLSPEEVATLKRQLAAQGLFLVESETRTREGERLLAAFRGNVLVLAGLVLLVSALTVYCSSALSLLGREGEIATLRTMGVPVLWILLLLLAEGGAVAVIGITVGCTIGAPITKALGAVFLDAASVHYVQQASLQDLSLGTSAGLAIGAAAIGLLIGLIGISYPAWNAAHTLPGLGAHTRGHLRLEWIRAPLLLLLVGVILVTASLLGVLLAPQRGTALLLALGLVLLVVAGSPFIYAGLLGALHRPFVRMAGVSGVLGVAAARYARRHALFTVGSAALGIALLIGLATLIASFRVSLLGWLDLSLRADIYIRPLVPDATYSGAVLSPEVRTRLESFSGIDAIRRYQAVDIPYGDQLTIFAGTDLFDTPSSASVHHRTFALLKGRLPMPSTVGGAQSRVPEALVSESAARAFGASLESPFTLGGMTLRPVGIYREFSSERPTVLLDYDEWSALTGRNDVRSLALYLEDSASTDQILLSVREQLRDFALIVEPGRIIRERALILFERTFQVTTLMRIIVVALGVLAFSLITLQGLWETRPHLLTCKTIGINPSELRRGILIEGGVMLGSAFLTGVPGGLLLAWILTKVVTPLSFGWSLTLASPGSPLVVTLALTFLLYLGALCTIAQIFPRGVGRGGVGED